MLPVSIDESDANSLHTAVGDFADTLGALASKHSEVPRLVAGFSEVLRVLRALDAAVIPAGGSLPSDRELGWPLHGFEKPETGPHPFGVDLASAKSIVEMVNASTAKVNQVMEAIHERSPGLRAPRELVRRFGEVFGYVYTELLFELEFEHPSIGPLVYGEEHGPGLTA